jgi:hypothetical protein
MPRGPFRNYLSHRSPIQIRTLQPLTPRYQAIAQIIDQGIQSKSKSTFTSSRIHPNSLIRRATHPFNKHSGRQSALSHTMATHESIIEGAKKLAATRAVAEHFSPKATYVGIGSGTTIIYVIEAIQQVLAKHPPPSGAARSQIQFIPTGYQSRQAIIKAGLTPTLFDSLPDDVILDVAFDGADEVDEDLNCIKGGGACLFQEKLVAERARKFVCVAGASIA